MHTNVLRGASEDSTSFKDTQHVHTQEGRAHGPDRRSPRTPTELPATTDLLIARVVMCTLRMDTVPGLALPPPLLHLFRCHRPHVLMLPRPGAGRPRLSRLLSHFQSPVLYRFHRDWAGAAATAHCSHRCPRGAPPPPPPTYLLHCSCFSALPGSPRAQSSCHPSPCCLCQAAAVAGWPGPVCWHA